MEVSDQHHTMATLPLQKEPILLVQLETEKASLMIPAQYSNELLTYSCEHFFFKNELT